MKLIKSLQKLRWMSEQRADDLKISGICKQADDEFLAANCFLYPVGASYVFLLDKCKANVGADLFFCTYDVFVDGLVTIRRKQIK